MNYWIMIEKNFFSWNKMIEYIYLVYVSIYLYFWNKTNIHVSFSWSHVYSYVQIESGEYNVYVMNLWINTTGISYWDFPEVYKMVWQS